MIVFHKQTYPKLYEDYYTGVSLVIQYTFLRNHHECVFNLYSMNSFFVRNYLSDMLALSHTYKTPQFFKENKKAQFYQLMASYSLFLNLVYIQIVRRRSFFCHGRELRFIFCCHFCPFLSTF